MKSDQINGVLSLLEWGEYTTYSALAETLTALHPGLRLDAWSLGQMIAADEKIKSKDGVRVVYAASEGGPNLVKAKVESQNGENSDSKLLLTANGIETEPISGDEERLVIIDGTLVGADKLRKRAAEAE